MIMKTQSTRIALVALTLVGTGCMEEFDPASLVAGTRVLGAQVTVDGDGTRSTPAPGETVTVDWLVTAPAEVPPLAWGFAICTGPQTCTLAAQGSDLPMRFAWTVPADGTVGTSVQVLGQICEGGAITWTDGQPGCSDGAKGTLVSQDIFIAKDGDTNRIPDLAARMFSFDGGAWNPGTTCDGLPTVALGSKGHKLGVTVLAEDRETFQTLDGDPPALVSKRETLQLSTFSPAGKLDRTFSYVEGTVTDAATLVEVIWDAPDTMPVTGPVVPFTLVARDGRGGLAAVIRAVCLQ
jgi:hypothetical protein